MTETLTAGRRGMLKWIKTILIGLIIFFGSAFTIMAFHNDIGIVTLFEQIYSQVTGSVPDSMGGLEIGYSVGLAVGILFFFNHLKLKKEKTDPTPLQVEMYKYNQDVSDTKASLLQSMEGNSKGKGNG